MRLPRGSQLKRITVDPNYLIPTRRGARRAPWARVVLFRDQTPGPRPNVIIGAGAGGQVGVNDRPSGCDDYGSGRLGVLCSSRDRCSTRQPFVAEASVVTGGRAFIRRSAANERSIFVVRRRAGAAHSRDCSCLMLCDVQGGVSC